MLKAIKRSTSRNSSGTFAIVASKYNQRYVNAMLTAAQKRLKHAGVDEILTLRVPGAFEIPVVAARLARSHSPTPQAIICLGVILRGETTHAQHIGEAVTQALCDVQVQSGVPVIHEVLLLENPAQAKARCLSRTHNRGAEAAETALEMARVIAKLQ